MTLEVLSAEEEVVKYAHLWVPAGRRRRPFVVGQRRYAIRGVTLISDDPEIRPSLVRLEDVPVVVPGTGGRVRLGTRTRSTPVFLASAAVQQEFAVDYASFFKPKIDQARQAAADTRRHIADALEGRHLDPARPVAKSTDRPR